MKQEDTINGNDFCRIGHFSSVGFSLMHIHMLHTRPFHIPILYFMLQLKNNSTSHNEQN